MISIMHSPALASPKEWGGNVGVYTLVLVSLGEGTRFSPEQKERKEAGDDQEG